jgi:hypothetical protein
MKLHVVYNNGVVLTIRAVETIDMSLDYLNIENKNNENDVIKGFGLADISKIVLEDDD